MIMFDNPTDKWICARCKWERDDKPESWSTCPNCDGDTWVEPHHKAWTTTPPTMPGLYRAIEKRGSERWVEIDDLLSPWLFGVDYPLDLTDFNHWLGPLPDPEPPKE